MTRQPIRALGIDLGSKRIGVAIGDRTGTIASPLHGPATQSAASRRDHQAIAELVIEEEAESSWSVCR